VPATDDIRQQAVELVDTCMADTASEHDIAMANRQLELVAYAEGLSSSSPVLC
jgi:hypothetical protein